MINRNTTCRDCKSKKLHKFLDLNDQPPANSFIDPSQIGAENFYPLQAYVCEDCQLVQLIDVVDLDELFQNYVYFTSGAGSTTPQYFTEYAVDMTDRFGLGKDSFVVELGSNDGLLLRAFKENGVSNVLGVDPAENVATVAIEQGIETVVEPWSEKVAGNIAQTRARADLIIGNNVVAHINDHYDLFKGVKALLAPEGAFVFEAPYLVDMFEELSFDTIYHEHLSCLALRPVKRLVESLGLEVFDMETNEVQGLSMRVFVGLTGAHEVKLSVDAFVKKELDLNLDSLDAYTELAEDVAVRKDELLALLKKLKAEGKLIAGYGAPAKGNTLLNYMQIGPEMLEYLTDEFPTKVGKVSPGMHIPVVHVDEARKDPPDYFLLLAWNYMKSILEKERELREKGVKFIVPIGKELKIV